MVNFVTNSFLTLFHFILRVFKKAVCCLKRRRRLSCEPLPLTNVGVVSNCEKEEVTQPWGSWEDPLTVVTATKPIDPVQQQIELYRQQRIASANETKEEPKVDYFQDMTPQIVRQTKTLLQSKEYENYEQPVSLSLAPDPVFSSSELGVWEDSQSWEDQTEEDWDANSMIKEKKRTDREKRLAEQQKKKLERESRGRTIPGTRIRASTLLIFGKNKLQGMSEKDDSIGVNNSTIDDIV